MKHGEVRRTCNERREVNALGYLRFFEASRNRPNALAADTPSFTKRSRSLLVTAASPSTTTQGLPPEAMIVRANIAILASPFYPLQGQFRCSWIAPMNVLPRDKQIEAISALTEGCSIRAIEPLTGIHRRTIMRLGVRVGNG